MYKPITDFRSAEPEVSDLRRLQNAVVTAFGDLDDERQARPSHVRATGNISATYDQAIEMLANGTVELPVLLPERTGRTVTVILAAGVTAVTVRPVDGSTIQGTTSDSLGSVGRYEYVCGITGWYR